MFTLTTTKDREAFRAPVVHQHARITRTSPLFSCTCGRTFGTRGALTRHVNAENGYT